MAREARWSLEAVLLAARSRTATRLRCVAFRFTSAAEVSIGGREGGLGLSLTGRKLTLFP